MVCCWKIPVGHGPGHVVGADWDQCFSSSIRRCVDGPVAASSAVSRPSLDGEDEVRWAMFVGLQSLRDDRLRW